MQAGPERPYTQRLVAQLERSARKNAAPIWAAAAHRLKGAARKRPEVNLLDLNRHAPRGATALVPGKLLSLGTLDHPVTVAAFAASAPARAKVQAAGGRLLKIEELLAQNPKGTNVILLV